MRDDNPNLNVNYAIRGVEFRVEGLGCRVESVGLSGLFAVGDSLKNCTNADVILHLYESG